MDIGSEHPSIIEYKNFSIAKAISEGLDDLFRTAISHLKKKLRKKSDR
jgi:hypothetical protein